LHITNYEFSIIIFSLRAIFYVFILNVLFCPYTISMLSFRTGLPQYRLSPLKAQILAYFQKILDIHSFVGIITQQLSNSATQQLSNSATQQLRRKVCLRSEKRAAFTFRQQHHYFSSIFADGKRTVRLFYFKPQRVPRMRSQIERRVDKDIPSKTLAFSASFAGALRKRTAKHILYSQDSSINFVPHNYTLCIINYLLFSAFYRRSRLAVWFDSG